MDQEAAKLPEYFHITEALLDQHIEAGAADRRAFVLDHDDWTYGGVLAGACQFGNALHEIGVRPGERVIILLPDSIEWVFAFLGTMRIGAIPVPLNTWMPPSDYAYFVKDSGARVLVADADLAVEIGRCDGFRGLDHLVVTDNLEVADVEAMQKHGAPRLQLFSSLVQGMSKELDPPKTRAVDPAFWLYSSGTTGRSKGVVHRHETMWHSGRRYGQQVLGVQQDDVVFSAAKMFFAYGLGNSLYLPLLSGGTTVLFPGRSTPAAVYQTLEKHRPTMFFCVPTLYAAMLQVDQEQTRDSLVSVRLCVSAGEPLPAEIYRAWKQRFGVEILDGIGSTELVHIYISNRAGSVQPGSSGVLVPGYDARIVDDAGANVKKGDIGNIEIRGPTRFSEYWNRPEATAASRDEDWFRTGDKYRIDEDGFYVYAGRSDDMMKVSGSWVSPFEVEAVLLEHDAVLECAVVGVEDAHRLIKPKALVVLCENHEASDELADELKAFVKSRLAKYKYPRWVSFVDSLPKTATGKVQRYKLRECEKAKVDGV
jgi:benzoate-CoA ligase family protein